MQFELLTLSGAKYAGAASEVIVNTASGSIAVYAQHEPLTTIVLPGSVVIRTLEGKTELFTTFGGLLEFENNVCRVLSDESEHSDGLVEKEIMQALENTKKRLENSKEKHQQALSEAIMNRHAVRLSAAKLKRQPSKQ
jgi:F-type H+-transporting ATPase subunit epsilon